jgi:hypothetical protein
MRTVLHRGPATCCTSTTSAGTVFDGRPLGFVVVIDHRFERVEYEDEVQLIRNDDDGTVTLFAAYQKGLP